jgi:hypothetical protein
MALADQDTESSDSEDDIAGKKRGRASRDLLILQQRFDKSPLGCLSRFVKKWLKIFMPVIIVLGIGMAVMMTSEIDPQITICEGVPGEDTSLCLFDNQTYTMTFVNGIYWGLVTGTTVGYGDISPTTDGNKIFCCFFLVFAVITTANALSTVGDALMSAPGEDQIGQILDKKLDAEFLMSLDMDGSGDVTEYEYLAAMVSRSFVLFYSFGLFYSSFLTSLFFSFFFPLFFPFFFSLSSDSCTTVCAVNSSKPC